VSSRAVRVQSSKGVLWGPSCFFTHNRLKLQDFSPQEDLENLEGFKEKLDKLTEEKSIKDC